MVKQQILIVEDDAENLSGLKMLILKYHPESIVFEAEDTVQARSIIHNNKIDLMFLDIQLPGEDGLTFLSSLKDEYPHLRTVIVSAYGTFFYAQKAIRLNVDEYLLKPYSPDDIERILSKTEDSSKDDGLLQEPMRSLFQRWLEGENSLKDSLLQQSILSGLCEKPVWLFLLKPLLGDNSEQHNYYRNNADHYAGIISQYWKSRQDENLLIFPVNDKIVGIVFLQVGRSEVQMPNHDTLETLLSFSPVHFSCIHTSIIAGSWHQIPSVYRKVGRMAGILFFRPPFSVLCATDLPSHNTKLSSDIRLSSFLKSNAKSYPEFKHCRADQTHDYLNAVLTETGENLQVFLYSVHKSVSDYIEEYSGYLTKSEYALFENRTMNLIDNCTHIDAFQSGLTSLLDEIEFVISNRQSDLHQVISAQMVEYVQQNINHADFTKDKAAEHFGFTPDYFGVLFKKATGKTFVEFVNEERINRAKALLKTTSMKVYQIALAVGIPDEKYFHRLFIRYTSITPNRFRSIYTSNE